MDKEIVRLLSKQLQDIKCNKPLKDSDKLIDVPEDLIKFQDMIYDLSSSMLESNKFLSELSQGNLDAAPPSKVNFLAGYLKELHAIMSHLSWQAEQVANGDYTQKMHYLGKLSDSFNIMTQQLQEKKAFLEEKSYTDELTGIYNRRFCLDYVSNVLMNKEDFSLVMIDIDRLKVVNDNLGHSIGDEYIKTVCNTIKDNIRVSDIFCRLGGDEFVVLFKNCGENSIVKKMDEIRNELRNTKREYTLSISYGVTYIPKDTYISMEEAFELSDFKMYDYKNKHRTII